MLVSTPPSSKNVLLFTTPYILRNESSNTTLVPTMVTTVGHRTEDSIELLYYCFMTLQVATGLMLLCTFISVTALMVKICCKRFHESKNLQNSEEHGISANSVYINMNNLLHESHSQVNSPYSKGEELKQKGKSGNYMENERQEGYHYDIKENPNPGYVLMHGSHSQLNSPYNKRKELKQNGNSGEDMENEGHEGYHYDIVKNPNPGYVLMHGSHSQLNSPYNKRKELKQNGNSGEDMENEGHEGYHYDIVKNAISNNLIVALRHKLHDIEKDRVQQMQEEEDYEPIETQEYITVTNDESFDTYENCDKWYFEEDDHNHYHSVLLDEATEQHKLEEEAMNIDTKNHYHSIIPYGAYDEPHIQEEESIYDDIENISHTTTALAASTDMHNEDRRYDKEEEIIYDDIVLNVKQSEILKSFHHVSYEEQTENVQKDILYDDIANVKEIHLHSRFHHKTYEEQKEDVQKDNVYDDVGNIWK